MYYNISPEWGRGCALIHRATAEVKKLYPDCGIGKRKEDQQFLPEANFLDTGNTFPYTSALKMEFVPSESNDGEGINDRYAPESPGDKPGPL